MHRLGRVASAIVVTVALVPSAYADETQLGAWVGPRIFSDEGLLGYIPEAPAHPALASSVVLGVRVARPLFPWLVPELELAMSPTQSTAVGGAAAVNVFWLDPRVHLRFELMPGQRLSPFLVIGGGAPIALSGGRKTFDSGIVGDGYAGGGVRFDTRRGFSLRFDARVSIVPGIKWRSPDREGSYIEAELDVGFGVELPLGRRSRKTVAPEVPLADRDTDGILDDKDACADRAEDNDGFDDLDGCPDIDNDSDGVLDIADRCSTVPESSNGFQDDDGCPDSVPAEVESLRGTVEGLLYAEGETGVRASAMPSLQKIATTMTAHPSIRVVLLGHTDDREAKQFARVVEGQPATDLGELAMDLSRARAEAVKQALSSLGVSAGRITVEGRGAEEPVSDNEKPKGRLANRRVEIMLSMPKR